MVTVEQIRASEREAIERIQNTPLREYQAKNLKELMEFIESISNPRGFRDNVVTERDSYDSKLDFYLNYAGACILDILGSPVRGIAALLDNYK